MCVRGWVYAVVCPVAGKSKAPAGLVNIANTISDRDQSLLRFTSIYLLTVIFVDRPLKGAACSYSGEIENRGEKATGSHMTGRMRDCRVVRLAARGRTRRAASIGKRESEGKFSDLSV